MGRRWSHDPRTGVDQEGYVLKELPMQIKSFVWAPRLLHSFGNLQIPYGVLYLQLLPVMAAGRL